MSGTITTGSIPRLLQEGIESVFGRVYDEHPTQWDKIFDRYTSRKKFELDAQLESFGLAPAKAEGDGIAFDSIRQGITPKYIHVTFAKGFIITKEALADELYGQFMNRSRALAFAMQQTRETTGANVLNSGFDSSFLMTDGDGVELFSSVHLNGPSGGTFSNELPIAADLSEASLEDILIQINESEDSRGLKIALQPICLIVAPGNAFESQRILGSVLQNDTANNAVNAIASMNAIRDGHKVNNYLTDADAWFVKTNCPDGMKYFERQAVEFGEDNAFTSGNARMKADERYSFGWSDPRGIFGSEGG